MTKNRQLDPARGGVYIKSVPHQLFFGGFRVKKGKKNNRPQNGPKMAQNGQKWSKLPQNRRNTPPPENSNASCKYRENGKNAPQCKVKMHQKDQQSAKMAKKWQKLYKNRFSLQQLPWKGHFLKEMHQKQFRLRRKKVWIFFAPAARILVMCGDPPRGGQKSATQPHSHTPLYRSLPYGLCSFLVADVKFVDNQ